MLDQKPVRKRRIYSRAFRLQVLAETREPFVSVAEVARRHGMNANVIFNWLRDARRQAGDPGKDFLPVEIGPAPLASHLKPDELSGVIVELTAGARVCCRDERSLVMVLRALKQGKRCERPTHMMGSLSALFARALRFGLEQSVGTNSTTFVGFRWEQHKPA